MGRSFELARGESSTRQPDSALLQIIGPLRLQAYRAAATIWTKPRPATGGNSREMGALTSVSGPFCPHEPDPFQALPSWSAFSLLPPPEGRLDAALRKASLGGAG